ncbi:starch-binding protein [Flammeovirga kamogawensis]|uniref:Starch-binding protein n=1 Tax=Flammeovirga kamogawensis TaxID=373891 RepID=A0ABX8H115_9BACT|nr:starch-binding protein [Flammeovirga kamogawensis]MBB6462409.1 hypothetical protein [Flammeovirga kamogawensis]QWG09521.1 starch-binding protein [Flammeovirga kamogawensis]TRX65037.1 starch-binding protein [Flammeovirga kamogawensis]
MKKKLLQLTTWISLLLIITSYNVEAQESGRGDVLLQGFRWEAADAAKKDWWTKLNGQVGDIKNAGFDAIWLPPPSDAGDRAGYLPRKWYDLNTNYGTEAELRALISNLDNNNVQAIADIVINHRVGTVGWAGFTEPSLGGCNSICSDDEVNWSENSNEHGAACGDADTGTQYEAARDLNHNSETVRTEIIKWMQWLKNDVGFDGWRYDFVHGFNAYYFSVYNNATDPYLSIGEQWKPYNEIVSWLDGTQNTSSAFDFPLKYTLHDAVKGNYNYLNGVPSITGSRGNQSITFLENHDTEPVRSEYGDNSFPNYISDNGQLLQGYAYILTHPGIPVVFYSHFFDYGIKDAISDLIAVRKDNGITNTSYIDVQGQDDNSYYAAIIDGKVAMKIGGGNWSPSGGDWNLRAYGNGYAVWDKGVVVTLPELTIETPSGNHADGCATLNMSATAGTIYYTLDGTTPTTSSAVYTSSVEVCGSLGESKTVKAIAINENGASAVQSVTFTYEEAPSMTVYFKPTCGNPNIYFWGVVGSATTTWPGESMQPSSKYEGYYEYTLEGSCTNLILLCGNGKITGDEMNICGDVWYDNGWVSEPIVEDDTQAPTLGITPNGGEHQGSVSVTLTATDNTDDQPIIYYSTDGSTPSIQVSSSVSFTLSSDATVRAYSVDASGNQSAEITKNFTVVPVEGGFTVRVQGLNLIHHWGASPVGSFESSAWPGVQMSQENGWYVFQFPSTVVSSNLLFHDNNGNKTVDLSRDKDGWYKDGVWHDQEPVAASGLTIHYKSSWGNSTKMHYWGASDGSASAWPGVAMSSEGNGWYTYTLEGVTSTNLLFHNGSGAQTGDLSRASEGWYKDGVWYNQNPEGSSARTSANDLGLNSLEAELSVFPTLITNSFSIKFSLENEGSVDVRLFSVNGGEVMLPIQKVLSAGNHKLDIAPMDLKSGVYVVKMQVAGENYIRKVIKQ